MRLRRSVVVRAAVLPALAVMAVVFAGCWAQTTGATNVGYTGATLNGKFHCDPNDGRGDYWFEYAKAGSSNWTALQSHHYENCGNAATVNRSDAVSGLAQNTTYRYRACGTNEDMGTPPPTGCYDKDANLGGTNYDSFTTPAKLPVVTNDGSVTDAYGTSATFHATVNPYGYGTNGQVRFEYGPTATENQTAWQSVGSGTSPVDVPPQSGSVDENKDWKFRVVARNGAGQVSGSMQDFWTGKTGTFHMNPNRLSMGFGVQRGNGWLQLNDPSKFNRNGDGTLNSVAEYLDYEQADWVMAKLSWCGADANHATLGEMRSWIETAAKQDKSTVLSLLWIAPVDYQQTDGDQTCASNNTALPKTTTGSMDKLNEMAQRIHDCLSGAGTDGCPAGNQDPIPNLLPYTKLEIGPEANWAGCDPVNCGADGAGEDVNRPDARFWYDAINYVAAQNNFPAGIILGGPMFQVRVDGWGSNGVAGAAYLDEALNAPAQTDPWEDPQHQVTGKHFDSFGIHQGHCWDKPGDPDNNRTTWNSCSQGGSVKDTLDAVQSVLSDPHHFVDGSKTIEYTALIPTDRDPWVDSQQRNDTLAIWNNLLSQGYASGPYKVDLLVWNHLTDTYQDNFRCTGFMGGMPVGCAPDNIWPYWPYERLPLFNNAHTWSHAIP